MEAAEQSEKLRKKIHKHIGWIFSFISIEQKVHPLSLSTNPESCLFFHFGCSKFHKFHSSTPASQISM